MIQINIRIIFILTLLCSTLSCLAKTPIAFENGQRASDCEEYNHLRETLYVNEDTKNQLLQAEYLECSITEDLTYFRNSAKLLSVINSTLKLKTIPTSLAPSITNQDTPQSVGFILDEENNSIKYYRNNQNVVLVLKGQLSEDLYLVWVVDEILDKTYRAYFPIKIKIENETASAMTYYKSGF